MWVSQIHQVSQIHHQIRNPRTHLTHRGPATERPHFLMAGAAIRAPLLVVDGIVLCTRKPIPHSAGAEFS